MFWGRALFFIFAWTIEMEKERYLNQLLDVIKVLRGPELDVARKHLKAYESNHTINRRKMFQLYKYIKINKIRDYEKLKKRISPDTTDDSFNKLIRRTTERVQESLIVDVNIRRKDSYNDVFRTKFFLRKQLIQVDILMGRGLAKRPLNMLNSFIRLAKKFELYDELVEALEYKQRLVFDTDGLAPYERILEKVDFYEKCREFLRLTKRIQRELEVQLLRKSYSKIVSEEITLQLEQIEKYYVDTKSANIQSYLLLMKLRIAGIEENFVLSALIIRQLIALLTTSPALFSRARISYLKRELANVEYSSLNFMNSLQELDNGLKELKPDGMVYVGLLTRKATIYIFLNDVPSILEILKHLNTFNFIDKYKYQKSILGYLEGISFFLSQDFKKSMKLLAQKTDIEKDKEGWNVWIRIMRLLCSIEMLKLNMIDYDIESFRKYLERTSKQYEVRERDKLVLKVLLELDKNDYNFSLTAVVAADELEKLNSTDKKYAWNPDSPELILFHDWFNAKLLKKEYEPNFEVYKEAMKK